MNKEEAMKILKDFHDKSALFSVRTALETLHPELKENEDDRIRNFISNELACLRATEGKGSDRYEELTNAIAWLEKQSEQKVSVVDFKAEDWYVSKVDGKIYNAKFMEQNSCKKTTRREEIEKAAFSTSGIIEQTDWFIKGAEWADEHPCCNWLEKQSEPTDINPSEFDLRLNKLLKQFETLPKEELIGSLSFWLNVVQNDGTYKADEKQVEQKPADKYNIRGIKSKNAKGKLGEMIKEMKSVDKVEPKFHEGEWIIRSAEGFKHNTYLVKEVKDYYACEDLKGQRVTFTLNDVHKNFKLWDISDAKPGDVLAVEPENGYHSPFIAIYKERGLDFFNSHCFISFDGKFNEGTTGHSIYHVHPATKEQRDLLFQKMHDAGYEWNIESKELKKIVDKEQIKKNLQDNSFRRMLEKKPADWSEEDESIVLGIEQLCNCASLLNIAPDKIDKIRTWLKSLKDKVKPKVEWGEEDERLLQIVIDVLDRQNHLGNISRTDLIACVRKLKSLRPQNTWKPSEELITYLYEAIDIIEEQEKYSIVTALRELLEQLKQL